MLKPHRFTYLHLAQGERGVDRDAAGPPARLRQRGGLESTGSWHVCIGGRRPHGPGVRSDPCTTITLIRDADQTCDRWSRADVPRRWDDGSHSFS